MRPAELGAVRAHPITAVHENVAALDVMLTEDDLARLEQLGEQVVGARY